MENQTLQRCELLMENRGCIKSVFFWESGLIHLACAGIYGAKDIPVDIYRLEECKELLKNRVSVFSNFRGNIRPAVASMMATSQNMETSLEEGLRLYELLKKDFWSSEYLVLAAMVIEKLAKPEDYGKIAARTRRIYELMKAEHPFLISGEDSVFCALLAVSEKEDRQLIDEMEQCYHILKKYFFSNDAVQSLCQVLALCGNAPEKKCERVLELYDCMKKAGCKYGTRNELPTLGIMALAQGSAEQKTRLICEIDGWLARQRGFGALGSISRKQRLMYAAVLAGREFHLGEDDHPVLQTAAVSGVLSAIIAQEAAMCAAVGASIAASAAASSASS
ncbi:MAG: DUF4003 domain-containing protein [Lachnospiraceae bacterium]|nr:DUF4003 domain-containing protein [Lachnospiraceae bacterium]